MADYKIIASKIVFKGKTFTIFEENVKSSDGYSEWHEVVQKNASVNVLYVDEKGRLYITREYRTALKGYGYKFPGGKAEMGEPVTVAARREFEEETGLIPVGLKLLYKASGGATTRWARYFFITRKTKPGKANPDSGEEVEILKLPLKKVVAMAWRGEFYSGETAYAVLLLAKKLRKL